MSDTPYIHTFRTSEQCYVYDVNTNKILMIPEPVYDYLSDSDNYNVNESVITFIENMRANGFLRSDRVEVSEHPATPLLSYYLNNKMQQLLLQVTQRCNLRCSYCIYSGSYKTRTHSNESMSAEMAEQAIDFFIKRTKDSKNVTVSFYGGEPLLNINLIRHCVNYIETHYSSKKIEYAMTTNGTLLDDSTISFLAENNFKLLISLDGPKDIHDIHRRFANNDEGTFSIIMDNIARIKNLHPTYYQANVRFNTVLDTARGFRHTYEFISGEEIFSEDKFNINYVSTNYSEEEINLSEEFSADMEYEYFKFLLSKLGEISHDNASTLMSRRFLDMYIRCFQNIEIEQEHIPVKFHHSGPCIPGARRLFVDTNGRFFPCERVSEFSEAVTLGNIHTGISLDKASRALNIETVTHTRCKDCWAYRQCMICVAHADDLYDVSDKQTAKRCPSVRNSIEAIFKDYCVLRELGYTFDEERHQEGNYV